MGDNNETGEKENYSYGPPPTLSPSYSSQRPLPPPLSPSSTTDNVTNETGIKTKQLQSEADLALDELMEQALKNVAKKGDVATSDVTKSNDEGDDARAQEKKKNNNKRRGNGKGHNARETMQQSKKAKGP